MATPGFSRQKAWFLMTQRPEQALQTLVAQWLDWALEPPAWYTAIPAGGGGELRGKILKGMGYKAGTSDLLFLYDTHAWMIELKYGKGTLTESQERTIPRIERAGCPVAVCYSLDAVEAQLREWGLPIRADKPRTATLQRIFAPNTRCPDFPPSDALGRRKRVAKPLAFR